MPLAGGKYLNSFSLILMFSPHLGSDNTIAKKTGGGVT
jgi:hypothetical protein